MKLDDDDDDDYSTYSSQYPLNFAIVAPIRFSSLLVATLAELILI